MSDAILVANAGSSSLKFSLYGVSDRKLDVVVRGQVEGLGGSARFKAKDRDGKVLADAPLTGSSKLSHHEAFTHIADWIREHHADGYSPIGVGHRVVHGGSKFGAPIRIDSNVIAELEKLIPLAPLHEPHNIAGMKAVMQLRPDLPQVACFDTAFHQGRQKVTQRFGLPDEMYEQGIRRWGFHGLSYESIAGRLKDFAPELIHGRVIVAHLGNGASLCAMREGRSVDTTMSFTALDGLPMGTRCGYLDPGVILYFLQQGRTAAQIDDLLYHRSGLLGISGESNDMRDLLKSNNPRAREAIEFFVYRITREIGSLTAALGGLDGLVFTAGVGENSSGIRGGVCEALVWLNVALDPGANRRNGPLISVPGKKPSVWVIPTDEEGVIASHTLAVIRPK